MQEKKAYNAQRADHVMLEMVRHLAKYVQETTVMQNI